MQVLKLRVHSAPLILALLVGSLASCFVACSTDEPVGAGGSCAPGGLHCVCAAEEGCQEGLACVANRCVELPGGGAGHPDASGSLPEQGPDVQDTASPTQDDQGGGGEGHDPDQGPSESGQEDPSQEQPKSTEQDACQDGVQNRRETDVDCGGPICEGCASGRKCRGGVDCDSDACVEGVCVDCEHNHQCDDENDCTADRCENNVCTHIAKPQGGVCDDGDACTAKDRCQASGLCKGESTLVLDEHFDDNEMRWRVMYGERQNDARSLWKLGGARSSDCGGMTGEDPAQDHTQNGKNGVAGMVLGGCNSREGELGLWDCLWSKDFEVYRFDEPVVLSFWRHLHTPASGEEGVVNRIVWRDIDEPDNIRILELGYADPINDGVWERVVFEVPEKVRRALGVGICYQKIPGAPSFAGWTIDDLKIRQRGCMPKR